MNSTAHVVTPRRARKPVTRRKLPPPTVIPTPLALGWAALVQLERLTDRAERRPFADQAALGAAFDEIHRLLVIIHRSPDTEHHRAGRDNLLCMWRMFPEGPRGLAPVVDLAAFRARRAS